MAADPIDRLHPTLVHHIVNTLGWPGLRPLQAEAIDPILDGRDALLLAPTAGGKTEAAAFPALSATAARSAAASGGGLQVLYLCPIKALLNNLEPRLQGYAAWLGLRAALWHGDLGQAGRAKILRDPPEVLLTTPESLEAMLISVKADHASLFANLHTVIVDEVHAFAGDDRGWHLLCVLERLAAVAGHPLQRVGLSATVGNPQQLLTWLRGGNALCDGAPAGVVVAPGLPAADAPSGRPAASPAVSPPGDVELDYVGSIGNAAIVIAALHRGEKRLVFCDSRRVVEELGAALRARGITVFLSHASLSADQRHRSEQAFADARDCVIVATSTLELGIDVGDLDRVIQIGAPTTVAAFLQRLGRTGRRRGSVRNCLFLTPGPESLLHAAGLLQLWTQGWVEPVLPPPQPRHIAAQQILAYCLQEGSVGDKLWAEPWNDVGPFNEDTGPILRHLVDSGFLAEDDGTLYIGTEAEQKFGRRHFLDLTAVFTAAPEFAVFAGRQEIGRTDPSMLTRKIEGPRRLLLAGRSWQVTHIDWSRHRCYVEQTDRGGTARWLGARTGLGYEVMRAQRDVLLGADPGVRLTGRAHDQLADLRAGYAATVHSSDVTVVARENRAELRWWTWAGMRANATLAAALSPLLAERAYPYSDKYVSLDGDVTYETWTRTISALRADKLLPAPAIDRAALDGLKFSAALPLDLATQTLAARLGDSVRAAAVLAERIQWERG